MLPKAHLTSCSKMSGSRWLWLSRSWRSFFVQFFCVFLPPLLNIFCFCYVPFLSFIELIFAWNIPLVSLIFLKRSLVFPILLFSSISLHWSLRKAYLSLLAVLWNSAFKWLYLSFSPLLFASLLSTAICKAAPDSHFAFLHSAQSHINSWFDWLINTIDKCMLLFEVQSKWWLSVRMLWLK